MVSKLNTLSMQVRGSVVAFCKDEEGATAAEYGIIASLIAVVIIGAVKLLGGNLTNMFNGLAAQIRG
jgi:pilus assembly protein Flp/PilA